MASKVFGYTRVSTTRQVTERQEDTLIAAGVAVGDIYSDTVSGAKFVRAGLDALLRAARDGDTVVVTALDRLGRSLSQIVALADELHRRGIILRSLKESIDYSTSVGRMLAGIFASLTEYERDIITERFQSSKIRGSLRRASWPSREIFRPIHTHQAQGYRRGLH